MSLDEQLAALSQDDPETASEAAAALAESGDLQAIPALADALGRVEGAAEALGTFGGVAAPTVRRILRAAEDTPVKVDALGALEAIGGEADLVLPDVVAFTRDPSVRVSLAAVAAALAIGVDLRELPRICIAFSTACRREPWALPVYERAAAKVSAQVGPLLLDPEGFLADHAIEAIGYTGIAGRRWVGTLETLSRTSPRIRDLARQALRRLQA